jgi:hypothetical protein
MTDVYRIYELSHLAARKRAYGVRKAPMDFNTGTFIVKATPKITIKPDLDMPDYRAMGAMRKHQVFWIGEHYQNNVSNHIAQTTRRHVIELGRGRREAGKVMERLTRMSMKEIRVPDGFNGSSHQYFEGLTANAATSARVTAQLNSFSEAGFTTFQVVNPNDHRTCETCQILDGKEFTVSTGMAQMNQVMAATTPEGVKSAQPFVTTGRVKELTGGRMGRVSPRGTGKLAKAGVVMPPYHFRCRCNVDVTESALRLPTPRPVRPRIHLTPIAEQWDALWGQENMGAIRKPLDKFMKTHFGFTKVSKRSRNPGMKAVDFKGDVLQVESRSGYLGIHGWDSRIGINKHNAGNISDDLKNILAGKGDKLSKGVESGAHTLFHEVIHGYNKMSRPANRDGANAIVEAVTELSSRKVVRSLLGVEGSWGFEEGFGIARPAWRSGHRGVVLFEDKGYYNNAIEKVLEIVQTRTGWTGAETITAVEEASLAMMKKQTVAKTNEQFIKQFVNNLPGEMSKRQRDFLASDLGTIRSAAKPW